MTVPKFVFAGVWDDPQFPDADYASIIGATRRLVFALREIEDAQQAIVEERLRAVGGPCDTFGQAEYVGEAEAGVYIDASAALATCALLATLFEGMFRHGAANPAIRARPSSPRRGEARSRAHDAVFWDITMFVSDEGVPRRDIAAGLVQFARAIENSASRPFPQDLDAVIPPLFYIRNKYLHLGYEWLVKDRLRVEKELSKRGWANHFEWARCGDKPWIAYLRRSFVDRCLEIAVESHKAFAHVHGRSIA